MYTTNHGCDSNLFEWHRFRALLPKLTIAITIVITMTIVIPHILLEPYIVIIYICYIYIYAYI